MAAQSSVPSTTIAVPTGANSATQSGLFGIPESTIAAPLFGATTASAQPSKAFFAANLI